MKWLFLVRRIYLPRNGADPCRTPALKRNLAFSASGAGDASIALLILAGLLHRNDCKVGVWQALHEGQQLFYAPSPGRVLFGSRLRQVWIANVDFVDEGDDFSFRHFRRPTVPIDSACLHFAAENSVQ
jgi:hypothetical protein